MNVEYNKSLKAFNTFGIDVLGKAFVEINNTQEVIDLIGGLWKEYDKHLVLGGGSNVLLCNDFDGLVIKNNCLGKVIVDEDDQTVLLQCGSGENWHETVLYAIENDWGGIENMSLIPGTVGAAPMQNIGAYGVELKEVFHALEAVEIATGQVHTFTKEACEFGYRESVFKHIHKGKYIITSVTLRLQKSPKVNITYGAIRTVLESARIEHPTIKQVSDAVIAIRQSKLPDPKEIGNGGSFFKNPIISAQAAGELKKVYPNAPNYVINEREVKIPAGWLIEQCGWKGKKVGNTGAHAKQSLVLVNYGGATGNEIITLAQAIKKSVKEKFGIDIQEEVNIIMSE